MLVNIVTLHSRATELTVDGRMDVLDMCFKVIARYRLVTLFTQNDVPLAVHLVDYVVALGNVSLATSTAIPVTSPVIKYQTSTIDQELMAATA